MTIQTLRGAGVFLLIVVAGCGGVSNPGSPPNDVSSGNFSLNIVASPACAGLADAGRNRSWRMGLLKTGSSVTALMQGWSSPATVFSQTNLAGSATGSSLSLTGYVIDTVDGCGMSLCYRAEGTITGTQSGNTINGSLNGVLAYDSTTCTASDHKVTFVRE